MDRVLPLILADHDTGSKLLLQQSLASSYVQTKHCILWYH
jgi:hypothetical protein